MIEMSKSSGGDEGEDSEDEKSKNRIISFLQKGASSLY